MSQGGRPRHLNPRSERQLVKRISTGDASNAIQAQKQLISTTNVKISAQTIRRALKRNGLKGFVKIKKPLLTTKHKQKRLEFTKNAKVGQ